MPVCTIGYKDLYIYTLIDTNNHKSTIYDRKNCVNNMI